MLVRGDVAVEPDESFTVQLSDPVNATLGRATATGTIVNGEPFVVSASGADVVEGNSGTTSATFTVTLDHAPAAGQTVLVPYQTRDSTAVAGSDYTARGGTLTFTAGMMGATITVDATGDTTFEPDELFLMTLGPVSATGTTRAARLQNGTAAGWVRNDDSEIQPTTLDYTGPVTVQYSDPLPVSARLTNTVTGTGVSGASVTLSFGGQSTTAGPTDATGLTPVVSFPVTQTPGTVTANASFGGSATLGPSSVTTTITVLREGCMLLYSGPVNSTTAQPTTLQADLGELDTTLGDRSGKTVTFSLTDAAGQTQTFNGTTDANGRVTVAPFLPAAVYRIIASFAGDAYYLPCTQSSPAVVTVAPMDLKVTGGGWIVPASARVSFGFNAISDQHGLHGQLQLQIQGSTDAFHGSVVSTMTGAAPTVTWTGSGEWRDLPGYTFTATAVDGAPDTLSVVITSPGGTVVFTTNGAAPLQGGNITVH